MPDLYQGHELIDLSLVDPDNRRTPDYALCSRLLDEFDAAPDGGADYAKTLVADPSDGRAKLLGVTGRAPLGDAAWGDTRIDVPGTADGATFVNVLRICNEANELPSSHTNI